MRLQSRNAVLAACLLCSAWSGCRPSWQSDSFPATGRVTINGEPPVGALVQLIPVGDKQPDERVSRPWGLVKEDGSFTLSTYDGEPGAPPGEYAFTITWPPDVSKPSTADRLRSRYTRPDQSHWRFTIKEGDNVLPPVEMTGVDVDMKAGASALPGPLQTTAPTKPRKGRR